MMNREPDASRLSARQLEILELVSKGCSNPEIAELLHLSLNTVKTHLANILKTLHVSNRIEASVWFEQYTRQQTADHRKLQLFIRTQDFPVGTSGSALHSVVDLLSRWELLQVHFVSDMRLPETVNSGHEFYCLTLRYQRSEGIDQLVPDLQYFEPLQISGVMIWQGMPIPLQSPPQTLLLRKSGTVFNKVIANHATVHKGMSDAVSRGYEVIYTTEYKIKHRTPAHMKEVRELLKQQLPSHPDWALLNAYSVMALYAGIVEGYFPITPELMEELAVSAQKACNLMPDSAYSRLAFSLHCLLQSRFADAAEHIELALEANPALEFALFLVGQIAALNGYYDEAKNHYQNYLEIYPEGHHSGRCYAGLTVVHYLAGEFDTCKQTAEKALLYNQTIQAGVCMILLSIAVMEEDKAQQQELLGRLTAIMKDNPLKVTNLEQLVMRIVPPDHAKAFVANMEKAGIVLSALIKPESEQ